MRRRSAADADAVPGHGPNLLAGQSVDVLQVESQVVDGAGGVSAELADGAALVVLPVVVQRGAVTVPPVTHVTLERSRCRGGGRTFQRGRGDGTAGGTRHIRTQPLQQCAAGGGGGRENGHS